MKTVLQTVVIIIICLSVIGVSVVAFGLYNVSARKGHLPGVSTVLHQTYRNAVRLRAPAAAKVPGDLDDPDRIALGARHFETACRFCHGAPGEIQSATAASMVPRPPHITEAVADWEPRHLFWILREGVKMSGMPHWPSEREDEVWTMVAYLAAIRDGAGRGPAKDVSTKDETMAYCATCHGLDGQSGNAFIPRLDILEQAYMRSALDAYRAGSRSSGFMTEAARHGSVAELRRAARQFAAIDAAGEIVSTRVTDGAVLAEKGTRAVPSCTSCHGPKRGAAPEHVGPDLAGQGEAYVAAQLRLWRKGARGTSDRSELMVKASRNLTDEQIQSLASYFSSLRKRPSGG